MQYDLLMPARIVFGCGRIRELPELAGDLGRRAFLISGSRTLASNGTLERISGSLRDKGLDVELIAGVSHEPEVDDVDRTVGELLAHQPQAGDVVIGVGGGAGIDLAKAAAALATNAEGRSVVDFLEGVGKGLVIERPPLPLIAVPTTAGTGSEATKNAVISSYDPKFKKSLRSPRMVPDVALVDPQLTVSVPAAQTAASGMDAITQLIEAYISCRAQPVPQALAVEGLRQAFPSMSRAYRDGSDQPARTAMAHAALLSGIALANSGLGMAHGVAAALGVHAKVPHGLACAVMLPTAVRVNRDVAAGQLATLARAVLPGSSAADEVWVQRLEETIQELNDELHIPRRLSELGVQSGQLPELVASSRGNSMNGNPRSLTDEELMDVLEQIL